VADRHRVDHQPVFIDQSIMDQRVDEGCATMGEDHTAGFALEPVDVLGQVPPAIRLSAHPARVSVFEKTTLGISFITSAYTPVVFGHTDAIASYVARPMMCVPASRSDATFHATTSSSSGGSPSPRSPSCRGRSRRG
jgi:hypothetical protein